MQIVENLVFYNHKQSLLCWHEPRITFQTSTTPLCPCGCKAKSKVTKYGQKKLSNSGFTIYTPTSPDLSRSFHLVFISWSMGRWLLLLQLPLSRWRPLFSRIRSIFRFLLKSIMIIGCRLFSGGLLENSSEWEFIRWHSLILISNVDCLSILVHIGIFHFEIYKFWNSFMRYSNIW